MCVSNTDQVCFNIFRTRADYGEKKEKFVYALSLVFIQCIVNALFAEASKFSFIDFDSACIKCARLYIIYGKSIHPVN